MDSYMEHANKHLDNFSQFADQFAKVFIPIVGTATKMSAKEPVSAYGVFKAAKDMANSNKKSKKTESASAKSSTIKKGKIKKSACAPARTKATGKGKPLLYTKTKTGYCKKTFRTDKGKPSSKTKKEASKVWDEYLVKQLETDDAAGFEQGKDCFVSEDSEEYCTLTDSDIYSSEYTINGSATFLEDDSNEELFSSTKDDNNQAVENLAQAIISKANKKRKSLELDEKKSKSAFNLSKMDGKRTKKDTNSKVTSRKSLPAAINKEDSNNAGNLLASSDYLKKIKTKKSKETTQNVVSTTANVKLRPISPSENIVKLNSIEEGKRAFKWLLNPVSVDDFFEKYWEQKACLIKRQQNSYFGHLISFESIDEMLLQNHVEFTKNIDVTSYKNGVRETLNPEGRALPPVVWDHYGQGCSIRLLNPQTFLPALYTLSATMQEYFHCLVGSNAYLTPPNSQGFAPHYDDIEAFVLQIEGRKRWKLYKPCRTNDILPRYSSPNFSQQEIGTPVLEEVLEPGDVLYFPRGTIHQASTEPGYHSLHITLSVYQRQSFADLFEKMLPLMLQKAIGSNLELRSGLPLHTFQHAGITYSGQETKERDDLTKKVTRLMQKCIRDMPLQDIMDDAIDQLAKRFQYEALPPVILPAEKLRTVFGSRNRTNESGECVCDYDIDERTNVRLLRANILRLVHEENKIRVYYYADNSKQYCEYECNFIEIEAGEAASVEVLIKYYPQYLGVSQLPMPTDEQKINLVTALWERGLLMMEKPLK